MSRAITPLRDLLSLWRLYRVFRRERVAIVHTHTIKAGILGRVAAKLAKVPVIVHTSHGYVFYDRAQALQRRLFVLLERVAAACSNIVFSVNSDDITTAIKERIASPSTFIRLGHGGIGINLRRFDPSRLEAEDILRKKAELGLTSEHKVIGFAGRLILGKGLIELFEAVRLLKTTVPALRVLIVGASDYGRPDVITPQTARVHGVQDLCIFTGHRDDMPELYAMMQILVFPSHSEGLPMACMEASAMKVPCVTLETRGCREVVQHGVNGLLVPPGDVPRLANAIRELLVKPEEVKAMGERARQLALQRFDEEPVFERIKGQYDRLLLEKGVATHLSSLRPLLEPVR
jgi:glycosyltransferase involved in cell wall biosynthesis